MLNYLFRATSGGVGTVAGLRPIEGVPGLENVDVTDKIAGHMSYRTFMPLILDQLGFPVFSDYFDEPEARPVSLPPLEFHLTPRYRNPISLRNVLSSEKKRIRTNLDGSQKRSLIPHRRKVFLDPLQLLPSLRTRKQVKLVQTVLQVEYLMLRMMKTCHLV